MKKRSLCKWSFFLTLPRNAWDSSCNHMVFETQKVQFHTFRSEPSVVLSSNSFLGGESNGGLDAHELLDEMPQLDVVSATARIGQHVRRHQHNEAIQMFSRMLCLDVRPNEFTFATVIPSSSVLRDLNLGKQFHALAMKMGLHSMVFVGSAVLDFYSKLSCIEEGQRAFEDIEKPNVVSYTTLIHGYLKKERFRDALQLFQEMPERNVVSWNAMIGGYSQKGHNEEALNLFVEMLREGLTPDECTFPCVISAAANVAALGLGKVFHACAVKFLGRLNLFVGNSLISFYAKCGNMEDGLLVFDRIRERNVVSWNAVICGFAQNGRGEDAAKLYEKMRATGCRPNDVTLLGLLWACNHAGLVDKGLYYFNTAKNESPNMLKPEHFSCMVDLLSRCGRFKEAQVFIQNLPFNPGIGFWKALLGGCHIHSNVGLAELAAKNIRALDPEDVSSYVMLSNAHCAAGRWEDVSMVRREMKDKGMKRIPGCSWIEIGSKIHVFINRDSSHDQMDEIYTILNSCTRHLRELENHNFLTGLFFVALI